MTVLQMSGTDEGTNQPPPKKRRLSSSRHKFEDSKHQSVEAWLTTVSPLSPEELDQMPAGPETMVNGYGLSDSFHQAHLLRSPEENGYSDSITPIAPLLNLGNTCFLNSVLYTLRFAPSFLHKLHHLNSDSLAFTKQLNANKQQERGSSLGRNPGKTGSWGNKDTFTISTNCSEMRTQTVVTKLHQLYTTLCLNELKDRMEPIQPNSFLHALREVNPIFEGNQQHDAHELLVCLLDIIREACELLYQQNGSVERPLPPCPMPTSMSSSSTLKTVMRKSLKISSKFIQKRTLRENQSEGDIKKYLINGDAMNKEEDNSYSDDRYSTSQNTIFEDFRGVSLLRTTCLECEQVTERKETFCDICVPIQTTDQLDDEVAVNKLYQSIIVTEEYLIDCNKYWCERCSRYNEAKRCVKYEKLPRLLTLHLKRFSSNFGTSVAKVNDHMPTPFTLSCFCEECLEIERADDRPHYYHLYAIIMHLGATIASGHYVAFVKTLDSSQEYTFCTRDKPKTSSLSRGSSTNSVSANSTPFLEKQPTIFSKYVSKLSSKSFNGTSGSANIASREQELRNRMTPTCKAVDCCTVRMRGLPPTIEQDANQTWLECDDETVRVLSAQELAEMLSPNLSKNSALTPYLLFYARADS